MADDLPLVVDPSEMSPQNLGRHMEARHNGVSIPLSELSSASLVGALRAYHARMHQTAAQNHVHPDPAP